MTERKGMNMSENEAIYKLLEKTKSDNDIFICRKCGRLDFRDTLDVLGSESGCCADCGGERHYEVELFGLLKRIAELETALEKYGRHLGKCSGSSEYEGHTKPCHCGYEQALKGGE